LRRKEVAVEDKERYQTAKKRVEDIKGLYIHVGLYLIVNLGLFTINMLTNPDQLWFYWPLLGWGVGVAIHAFVFATEGKWLGPEWEDRKIHELMERDDPGLKKGA
jgi:hypothetical protein